MNFFIGIEELAANALIESLKDSPENRFLSYDVIERYGHSVVKSLNEKGNVVNLYLSKENTRIFLMNNSDFFEEKMQNNEYGLYLKNEKGLSELIRNFRGYLAVNLLLAFTNTPLPKNYQQSQMS